MCTRGGLLPHHRTQGDRICLHVLPLKVNDVYIEEKRNGGKEFYRQEVQGMEDKKEENVYTVYTRVQQIVGWCVEQLSILLWCSEN